MSLQISEVLYVIAASDKQQCSHFRPTHKNPSKPENGFRGSNFHLSVMKQPTQNTVFLLGGLIEYEERADKL